MNQKYEKLLKLFAVSSGNASPVPHGEPHDRSASLAPGRRASSRPRLAAA
ncbi:unnamed protein product [Prorocentrum cordatum]|uniref:Uncharacterized protein n=1 Tax=Prorocentrum cordatum TaxID=2364126 RepID=A0ABN9Y728_9DINO|nr:unnamed protein product [Polarella glacialis]